MENHDSLGTIENEMIRGTIMYEIHLYTNGMVMVFKDGKQVPKLQGRLMDIRPDILLLIDNIQLPIDCIIADWNSKAKIHVNKKLFSCFMYDHVRLNDLGEIII